jgi:Zn-dependent peptidase ImmA (M78 family)
MADLLRTLAHELVHRKQSEDGRIDYNSGKTGSEIENEANAMAGVLLRKFGKQNEEIYQ